MRLAQTPMDAPYQSVPQACKITGLAQSFLRAGCKAGTVPHIKCGNRVLVNVPLLLQQLEQQAMQMEG